MRNKLTIVGCGPGSKEFLTLAAVDAIERTPIVMGTKRLLELFNESNINCKATSAHSKEAIVEIEKELELSDVVVLVTGDATLFSLGNSLAEHFESVEIIPGISSVQLAHARLGIPFQNSMSFSAHGRIPNIDEQIIDHLDSFSILCGTKDGQKFVNSLCEKLNNSFSGYALIDLSLDSEQIIKLNSNQLLEMPVYSRMLVVFKRNIL